MLNCSLFFHVFFLCGLTYIPETNVAIDGISRGKDWVPKHQLIFGWELLVSGVVLKRNNLKRRVSIRLLYFPAKKRYLGDGELFMNFPDVQGVSSCQKIICRQDKIRGFIGCGPFQ